MVGFPLGATTPDVKHYETRRALFDGAREIDMVINVGALKSGDLRVVERDIEAVTGPCREAGAISKVIIEAALLTDEEKVTACTLAKAAAADYVKTSTGFGPGGATAADVALMRRVVGDEMGVKAAGGVKDLDALKAMVAAGATRIGASAGVRIVQQSKGGPPGRRARILTVRQAGGPGRSDRISCGRGSSSAVERELPKLDVAGSIPVSRSTFQALLKRFPEPPDRIHVAAGVVQRQNASFPSSMSRDASPVSGSTIYAILQAYPHATNLTHQTCLTLRSPLAGVVQR